MLDLSKDNNFRIDSGTGDGQWNSAPWLAILHRSASNSATAGFYPVFLFEPGFKTVCLVLAQGAENLMKSLGRKASLIELRRRAEELRDHSKGWQSEGFSAGGFKTYKNLIFPPPDGQTVDPWAASVAYGVRFPLDAFPTDDEIIIPLKRMLGLYKHLAAIRDLNYAPTDAAVADLRNNGELPKNATLDGAKRVISHKNFEQRYRNRSLIAAVKKNMGYTCEACGFIFELAYGTQSKPYIEAHHKTPISSLDSMGAKLTATGQDFHVLCSTCHRVIHAAGCPPLDIFRKELSFSFHPTAK